MQPLCQYDTGTVIKLNGIHNERNYNIELNS